MCIYIYIYMWFVVILYYICGSLFRSVACSVELSPRVLRPVFKKFSLEESAQPLEQTNGRGRLGRETGRTGLRRGCLAGPHGEGHMELARAEPDGSVPERAEEGRCSV